MEMGVKRDEGNEGYTCREGRGDKEHRVYRQGSQGRWMRQNRDRRKSSDRRNMRDKGDGGKGEDTKGRVKEIRARTINTQQDEVFLLCVLQQHVHITFSLSLYKVKRDGCLSCTHPS